MSEQDKDYSDCTPQAFRQALLYLYDEAMSAGWAIPAHFIGVASEAMKAYEEQPGGGTVIPFVRTTPPATDAKGAATKPARGDKGAS